MPSNRQNHNPQAMRQKPISKEKLAMGNLAAGSGQVKDSSLSGGGTGKVANSTTGASNAKSDGSGGQVSKTKTGTSGK